MPSILRRLTFTTPSLINDTDKAHAKAERDFKEIVREAVRYFGPERVAELIKEVAIARRGNKPNRQLNELLLAKWDAAAVKDPTKFCEDFLQKHPQDCGVAALKKRLERLRKAREKARDRERKLKAALRPSLVGEARGTE